MASSEHLVILKQGMKVWNKWREENPNIVPDLRGAELPHKALMLGNFSSVNLEGVNLHKADLGSSDLRGANLRRANLSFTSLNLANLYRAVVQQANLHNANVAGADLRGSNLRGADLRAAYLREANFRYASLHGADLTGVDIFAADFSGADLSGVDLSRARMWSTTFGDNDLSEVKGLETIHHKGPSIIGIETIYRSKGNIPEVFLRGAGVPEQFIAYMRSLVAKPVEFYSCFISYSSKDEDFARRLHADLARVGVRCWYAPEDLRVGEKFLTRIDEAIRTYDKLLLILSKSCIKSAWAEKEVEAALDKEDRQKRLVLFPIRLDDAVMETRLAWASHVRRTRHIGDFRGWKEKDSYQKALSRLVRDLTMSAVAEADVGGRDER